jgi:triphosphatase
METELKLTTSPAHLHKISAQRLLQDFATQEPSTHHLVSHYFDTPDNALHQRGLSLRVRQEAQHPDAERPGRTGRHRRRAAAR